ncbi:hypothetical protein ARMSODRAFT_290021 [Armillaria solidipes]|uniref:Uncharacterized protein n=1 Tax=Armillaria solidipes TaxID=1076256 RepID=A0A2H3CLE7_9AGAR|nr:hypothetical protein ARMSODRAFT_290021 [Armillaria solidipes]
MTFAFFHLFSATRNGVGSQPTSFPCTRTPFRSSRHGPFPRPSSPQQCTPFPLTSRTPFEGTLRTQGSPSSEMPETPDHAFFTRPVIILVGRLASPFPAICRQCPTKVSRDSKLDLAVVRINEGRGCPSPCHCQT